MSLLPWKRPSFWTAVCAVVVYWDSRALYGAFVYDDAGSVVKNVVVNGQVPWKEAFTRDFWGQEMKDEQSHKSFRPITTLTFKANYVHAMQHKQQSEKTPPTYSFHVTNVLLHGLVTALITESTSFIFTHVTSQLIVGFLFGLHPVHAEVVSNVTSRGELLMSLFMLTAFLSFASSLGENNSLIRRLFGIYIVPWLGMTLSLFSKEQGATTLISLVLFDFLKHHGNVVSIWKKLGARDKEAWWFAWRTLILALQTLIVVVWRYILNGETSPDFIEAQNPAGFAKDWFTRAFSVSWVYCLYIRDALFPYYLCPDWSGQSIDLIHTISDYRAVLVLCLWYTSAMSFWSMIVGPDKNGFVDDQTMRIINMAVWAFAFSPFLLSSNILVVVGLMKADRVIYLPLYGFCILEALVLSKLINGATTMVPSFESRRQQQFWAAHWFFMFQLLIFSGKTHDRNLAWSDSLRLWEAAYAINPRSFHTAYNYGYELSIRQRYEESAAVLGPIGNPHVDGPNNTFVYAMVLFNLKRCEEARELLDEAFAVIQAKREEGGVRNSRASLARTESNLMVAKAHCTEDWNKKGAVLYEAVEMDPSNEYAVGVASSFMEKLQEYEKLKAQYS